MQPISESISWHSLYNGITEKIDLKVLCEMLQFEFHPLLATPELTQKESKRLIDNLVDAQVTKAPSVADIAKAVGRELQITMDLLRGPGRKSSVVRARGLAMFLIRQWTVESYQNIGAFFGGRDHTTVMHACKKTEEDLASDHELTRTVDRVRQRLKLST